MIIHKEPVKANRKLVQTCPPKRSDRVLIAIGQVQVDVGRVSLVRGSVRVVSRPGDSETIRDGDQLADFMDEDGQGHAQDAAHGQGNENGQ